MPLDLGAGGGGVALRHQQEGAARALQARLQGGEIGATRSQYPQVGLQLTRTTRRPEKSDSATSRPSGSWSGQGPSAGPTGTSATAVPPATTASRWSRRSNNPALLADHLQQEVDGPADQDGEHQHQKPQRHVHAGPPTPPFARLPEEQSPRRTLGTYRFRCDVSDHESRGMHGTFEVR